MLLFNRINAVTLLFALSATADKPKDAILLSDVQSLTLRGGRSTSHRRVPAIPQLSCTSDPRICAKHPVDLMRCTNDGAGWGGPEDVQWTCTAQLPPELRLGGTDVVCEGYSGPDDPYVLRGSCGVEYELVLTPEGEARWPDLVGGGGRHGGSGSGKRPPSDGAADRWFGYLFWVVFVSVVCWIAYSMWRESQQARRGGGAGGAPRQPRRYNGGGGGGGGGGDGWDDPPPPYPGGGGSGNGAGYTRKSGGSRSGGSRTAGNSGGSNWQSNFLSGAAGAAAGYYAGSRGRNNNNNNGGYEGGGRGYGSTWGSGNAGPSRSGSSGSSSGSAASNSRYESTGFGSTSRR